ncbi:MAG: hypothetical protein ACJAWV_001606 [Flammeovirgaceae bacterium]|jgi:hypothetical protein
MVKNVLSIVFILLVCFDIAIAQCDCEVIAPSIIEDSGITYKKVKGYFGRWKGGFISSNDVLSVEYIPLLRKDTHYIVIAYNRKSELDTSTTINLSDYKKNVLYTNSQVGKYPKSSFKFYNESKRIVLLEMMPYKTENVTNDGCFCAYVVFYKKCGK